MGSTFGNNTLEPGWYTATSSRCIHYNVKHVSTIGEHCEEELLMIMTTNHYYYIDFDTDNALHLQLKNILTGNLKRRNCFTSDKSNDKADYLPLILNC